MSIKVTVGEQKTQEKPFPKLMIGRDIKNSPVGMLVLFIHEGCGVVIDRNGSIDWSSGEYSTDFSMQYFTDYNEPITIQND